MEKFLHYRNDLKMSYPQIGRELRVNSSTVFTAVKRYRERGVHFDNRAHNGQNNPRAKITPAMQSRMLDRSLLQEWSGLNLQ